MSKKFYSEAVTLQIKHLFSERKGGAWGDEPKDQEGIVCIRAADFITERIIHKSHDLTRRVYDSNDINRRQLRSGDLIIEISGGGENQPVGRVVSFALNEPALCSNFLQLLRPNPNILYSRFGAYLLYSLWANRSVVPFIKQTTGIQNLDSEGFLSQKISIPSLSQQKVVACYLDKKTAKIDALIAAKQKLLTLLAEKRRALITHAVTRGLDPNAQLRESGINFIKAIPKDWEIINLKFLGEVRTGVAKGRDLSGRVKIRVPYLRVANVQDGYLDLSNVSEIEILPEELSSFSLRKGDVLMNEGGDADKLGRGAVWDGSISPCLHQNHVFAVRCQNIEPEWLTTITGSDYAKAYFESRSKQSTNLASISATNIREFPVIVPPKSEREEIINYIQFKLTKLDKLYHMTESVIDLLYERRSALISEKIFGKIDVLE